MPMAQKHNHPLITLKDVCKRLKTRTVLKDISLSINPQTITTIIGPNGAGKTTLLRVILDLDQPSSGHVNRSEGIKLGYVPQRFQKDPMMPLSVQRFLQLAPTRPDHSLIDDTLSELNITQLKQRDMNDLSGGELQRVLLARALLGKPDVLALDEPLQGVDLKGQIELYQLIAQINRRYHCSVVMVSHDLHFVMAQTDQVVCLNQHICCSGQAKSVRNHPEYQKLFGLPNIEGLGIYSHHHDHTHQLNGSIEHSDENDSNRCEYDSTRGSSC